jgi:hypothetical protein
MVISVYIKKIKNKKEWGGRGLPLSLSGSATGSNSGHSVRSNNFGILPIELRLMDNHPKIYVPLIG